MTRASLSIRPSALEWVYLAVGLGLIVHYRWLFDDAFVYFRYVDNFLFLNAGLAFNAGEYVEGFTSPAQCLVLLALRAAGTGYPLAVAAEGALSWAIFWFLLVVVNRALSPEGGSALNLPLAFLSVSYPVTSFFTSGLETPLVHVAAGATAYFVLRPRSRLAALAVAAAPLARPELAVVVVLAMAWAWWRTGRFPRSLLGAALFLNGAWLLFRIQYYADLLPNTFYLKDGSHPGLGWSYLWDTVGAYHLIPFGLGLGVLHFSNRRRGAARSADRAARLAMLGLAAVVALYVVRVGGSAMHYYYLAFPLTLAVCAAGGVVEEARNRFAPRLAVPAGIGAMVAVSTVSFTLHPGAGLHPAWVSGPQETPGREITDPTYHRHHATLQPSTWQTPTAIERQREFARELPLTGYRGWTIRGWCREAYVHFDHRSVHRFGLTDAILARVRTEEGKKGHKPGLKPLAQDIVRLQKTAASIGRGMYRDAVEAGRAPEWVARNLDTIEVIERKMYNEHDFFENLGLAFRFPPRIDPGPVATGDPS